VGFGNGRRELEANQPVGGDGVAVDFGRRKIPAVRGLQGLVSEILAGAGGKEFRGGNIADRIDVQLNGYADSAADGGESSRRDLGHNLLEYFALSDGASRGLGRRIELRRIGRTGESGRR